MIVDIVEQHVAIRPPAGAPSWDVDPYATEILLEPSAFYEELRARGPFVYLPKYAVLACGRYEETKEVFSDWSRFVSSRGVGMSDFRHSENWRKPSIVLEADPPAHTRARSVIGRALSPRAVSELKAAFQQEADALVERLLARSVFDGVTDVAEAFALSVFPKAVGLRQVDRRPLLDYGAMGFDLLGPDNDLRRRAFGKAPQVIPWVNEQCSRERLLPNGFGAAIFAAADAGEVSEEEAALLVRSLLSAGIDTTVTAVGNALWCLALHPQEFTRLTEDQGLVRPAIEEALRFASPIHSFFRTASRDTRVGETDIPADTKLLCVLSAANLDPEKWPDPVRFDIGRRPVGHLAFGTGVHGCVGQNVARAEAEAVLKAIAERVSAIEVVGEPVWRPNNSLRALESLPLRFVPR